MKKIRAFLTFLDLKIEPLLFLLFLLFSFCGKTYLFGLAGHYFQLSFWISLLSVPLCLLLSVYKKQTKYLCKTALLFAPIFLSLSVSSLGSAIVLNLNYYNFLGTNTLKIWAESFVKYAYDFIIIVYVIYHLAFQKPEKYKRVIYLSFFVWVGLGLFQLFLVILNNSTLWLIYERLDFLKILAHSNVFSLAGRRFYSFLSEPAQNAKIICLLYLPFFITAIFKKDISRRQKILNIVFLLVTLACAFLTKSSTVYVGVVVFILVTFAFLLFRPGKRKRPVFITLLVTAAIVGLLFAVPYTRDTLILLLNKKIFGTGSFSTRYRYSSVYNDIKIFLHFPLFGVGDGAQGLFYLQNVGGTWMSFSAEAQTSLSGQNGVIEGGAAIPAFISGFGLFGVAMLGFTIFFIKKHTNFRMVNNTRFKLFYIPALISFCVVMTVAADFHRNYPLFVFLSMPFFGEFTGYRVKCFREFTDSIEI